MQQPQRLHRPPTQVRKRNGQTQPYMRVKLERRLWRCMSTDIQERTLRDPLQGVHVDALLDKLTEGIFDEIPTTDLDQLLTETCAYQQQNHPDFSRLAGRLVATRLWKDCCCTSFSESVIELYRRSKTTPNRNPISDDVHHFVLANRDALDKAILSARDLRFDYFGIQTLWRSYLQRIDGVLAETPQFLYMRAACGVHWGDLPAVLKDYEYLSQGLYSLPSSALCYAGGKEAQTASCFLLTIADDSIAGIFDTVHQSALISASGGGGAPRLLGQPAPGPRHRSIGSKRPIAWRMRPRSQWDCKWCCVNAANF